jgi:hypothetical protein
MEKMTMEFQEFLFWIGFAITFGMSVAFGGLLGFGLVHLVRSAFNAK